MDSDPTSTASSPASPPYEPKGGKPKPRKIWHLPGWKWHVGLLDPRRAPYVVPFVTFALFVIIYHAAILFALELNYVYALGALALAVPIGFLTRLVINRAIKEASEILFAPFGVQDENAAYELLHDYLIARWAPILLLKKGTVEEKSLESPLLKMGLRGPGYVRVDAHTAILIQKGNGNSYQVKRVGEHFLGIQERLRGWVDISVQKKEFALAHVYTRDNIPLCVKGTLYYRLAQTHDVIGRNPKDMQLVTAMRFVLNLPKWTQTAEETAEAKLRDLFAEFDLNDIHGTYPQAVKFTIYDDAPTAPSKPATRAVVQERLDQALNLALNEWGCEALAIAIQEITLPLEIEKTLREAWATAWNNQIKYQEVDNKAKVKRREAEGERDAAEIKRTAEILSAQAEAEALRVTMASRTEATFEYLRRVEQFAKGNEIKLDTDLMREMLRTARWMMERTKKKRPRPEREDKTDKDDKSKKSKSDADDDADLRDEIFEDEE